MTTTLQDAAAILGLRRDLRNILELAPVIRKGLPATSFEAVSKRMALSTQATAEALGLAQRTIARRVQQGTPLDAEESERVVRLARVLAEACSVLGDLERARRWLLKRSRALDEVPVRLLDTDIGTQAVLEELGRIDHGVFA